MSWSKEYTQQSAKEGKVDVMKKSISIGNQLDVTFLSFLIWQLCVFRAFFAHLQES
jgi:hypothetical protein